jgi:pimeloyl-ACP methyl ester carboxylesterase
LPIGFGDSSKPLTGYDGKTTAEDIYQLMKLLGFNKIFLAAHDVGSQTAFSYTAYHPKNVTKLVIMDFFSPALGPSGPWWFSFYQQQDIPEMLVQGHEREYLSSFMRGWLTIPLRLKMRISMYGQVMLFLPVDCEDHLNTSEHSR